MAAGKKKKRVAAQPAAPVTTQAAAPAMAAPPVNWGELGQFMGDTTSQVNAGLAALGGAGGSGGGGSATFNYSGGGGAAGGGGGGVAVPMPADIASDQSNLLKMDPRYQQQFDDLGVEAKKLGTGFVDLDEQQQADLDASTAAQRAAAQRVFSEERDALLTRLYSGGTHQSSMGADAAGRMLGDQAMVESDIAGDAAQRRLALRQALTDNSYRSLALRGEMAGQQSDTALRELGINVDQLERGRDRRAGMWEAQLASQTDIETASIGAGAQVASAQLALEGDKFGSLVGLFGDMSRTAEDARQFNLDLGERGRQFDTGLAEDRRQFDLGYNEDRRQFDADLGFRERDSKRGYDVGMAGVNADRYATRMNYQLGSERLGFDRYAYDNDSAFRDREFSENVREFDLGHELDKGRLDLDRYVAEREHWYRSKQLKYGRRKAIVGSIGSIMGGMMGGGG